MKPERLVHTPEEDSHAPELPGHHILFVLEYYFPNIGGVEKLFRQLVEELDRKDVQVTVLTTRLHAGQPFQERQSNITILRYRFLNRYLFGFLAIFPAFRHAKACTLVHTTSFNAALPAFLAASWHRKPVVITFHEAWGKLWFRLDGMHRILQALHYLYEWFLLRLPFDRFVAVSDFTKAALQRQGVAVHRIRRIYNGIEYPAPVSAPKHLEPPAPGFRYLYFGRIGISKGIYLLLEAARIFRDSHPGARLTLVVPTNPEAEYRQLRERISAWDLDGHVEIRSDLPEKELMETIRSSDAVVIPSQSEGFCFAAAETAALGVPILSSGRGALPEVVSGRYLHLADYTVEAMVRALAQAAAGEWQECPLRRFERRETIIQYLSLYRSLVTGSDATSAGR